MNAFWAVHFVSGPCARLSWPVAISSAFERTLVYYIVSYIVYWSCSVIYVVTIIETKYNENRE